MFAKDNNKVLYIAAILRIGFGVILIYSCIHKISDPALFLLIVKNYQVLPDFMAELIASILPWLELFTGLCLLLGIYVEGSCTIVIGMFLAFAYGIGINMLRGRALSCGCFSLSGEAEILTWWSLTREFVFIAVIVFVLFVDKGLWSIVNLSLFKKVTAINEAVLVEE